MLIINSHDRLVFQVKYLKLTCPPHLKAKFWIWLFGNLLSVWMSKSNRQGSVWAQRDGSVPAVSVALSSNTPHRPLILLHLTKQAVVLKKEDECKISSLLDYSGQIYHYKIKLTDRKEKKIKLKRVSHTSKEKTVTDLWYKMPCWA